VQRGAVFWLMAFILTAYIDLHSVIIIRIIFSWGMLSYTNRDAFSG
jgi:hypothetical protein